MSPVSPASDFAQPETKEITLPKPHNGKTVSVKIRAIPASKAIAALEGIAQLSRGEDVSATTFEEARRLVAENDLPMRRIVALGVVEPVFVTNGQAGPGEADWDNVGFENQQHIVGEIMAFSGLGPTPSPVAPVSPQEAAQAAGEFRNVAAS
jgi:hypothetical protein